MPLNTDAEYWKKRWESDRPPSHLTEPHPLLARNLDKLIGGNEKNAKVLVPCCGKSVDMTWLASKGHEVVGVEYFEGALQQFFDENNMKYSVEELNDFKLYKSQNGQIRLYAGDFLKFTREYESTFGHVWDRAAYIALPYDKRAKYARTMLTLLDVHFNFLLDTIVYNPELYEGPPCIVTEEEIKKHYGSKCKIEKLDECEYRAYNEKMINEKPRDILYLLTNF